MGLLSSLTEGIGSGLASFAGGLFSRSSNKREAQRDRNFQERMSSTSHRREVEDLRLAGLNPILSANSGASTPGGGQAAAADNVGEQVSNTALTSKRIKQELKSIESTVGLQTLQGEVAKADAVGKIQTAKQTMLQNKVLEAQLPAVLKHGKYDEDAAPLDAFMKRLIPAASAIGNMRGIPLPTKAPKSFNPIGIGGPR